MKIVLILQLLLISAGAFAEVLKAPAVLKVSPEGEPVVRITKDLPVTCVDSSDTWRSVGFSAYAKPAIVKGDALYDSDNRVLGTIEGEFSPESWIDSRKLASGHVLSTFILFANSKDIAPDSIVESGLLHVIKGGKATLESGNMQTLFKKYGFKKWEGYAGVESYGVYENWIEDPSPGFRILLIFYKGELSVVMHTRKLDYAFEKSASMPRAPKLNYLKILPKSEEKKLEKFYSDIFQHAD